MSAEDGRHLERVPPHDTDAEIAVLGSLLLDPSLLPAVKRQLRPADFYRGAHRAVYQAALELDTKGEPADPLLVRDHLLASKNGALRDTDVPSFLADLVDAVATPAHAAHYAALVRKASDLRGIITAGSRLQSGAWEPGADPVELQRAALEEIAEAAQPRTAGELPWRDLNSEDDDLDEPEWLWNGYLALERITLLSGHAGCGKTTLYYGLISAMIRQAPLLGRSTAYSPAVILTEEAPSDWRPRAKRFGLEHCSWLDRSALHPKRPLDVYLDEAYKRAYATGAYLIVIDPWAKWAGFGPDEEKDAGAVERALQPVHAVAGKGMAVLGIHHLRKSDGDEGTGVRGSGHLLASVETSLELRRFGLGRGGGQEDLRVLTVAKSRYPSPPGDAVYHHDPGVDADTAFTLRGDPRAVRKTAGIRRVVDYVEAAPGWVDADTVAEALGAQRQTTRKALAEAFTDGVLQRSGSGKRGDPYKYKGLTQ